MQDEYVCVCVCICSYVFVFEFFQNCPNFCARARACVCISVYMGYVGQRVSLSHMLIFIYTYNGVARNSSLLVALVAVVDVLSCVR